MNARDRIAHRILFEDAAVEARAVQNGSSADIESVGYYVILRR